MIRLSVLLVALFISRGSFGAFAHADDLKMIKVQFGSIPAASKDVRELQQLREAEVAQKWPDCTVRAHRAEQKFNELGAWALISELRCANAQYLANKKSYKSLSDAVKMGWAKSEWLLKGPQMSWLRTQLVDGSLRLLDEEVKTRRKDAWVHVNQLLDVKDWLDRPSRGRLYRSAGELSFAQQNLQAARNYYALSLADAPDASVRARLDSLVRTLEPAEQPKVAEQKPTEPPASTVGAGEDVSERIDATPEELEIYRRMMAEEKSNDYLAEVEDAMLLVKEYPGSTRTVEATHKVIAIYMSVASHSDDKYQALKDKILEHMRKADGQRLFDWATTMTAKGYYNDAAGLAQNSLEQMGGQAISTRVVLLCGLAAYHASDFKHAREFFERLVREHAGSRAGAEAYFRLGVMEFRAEKYAEAAGHFDRYLDLDNQTEFDLSSMYWSWRAYQKLNSPKAAAAAERLLARYPLSYFGLRARAELANGHLTLAKDFTNPVRYALALRPSDAAAWDRFLLLVKAGWFDEARAELTSLTPPTSAEGQLVFAELWSLTHEFQKSAEYLTKAFEKNPDYVTLSAVKIIYPSDFKENIAQEARRYNIPVELVQALIKQESSFRTDARSSVGAMGLMQLMPVTAREVASDMRIKLADLPSDMAKPQINIRIGTQYLHRRLHAFDDHVPLALASYNAGIGNIRSWLKSRQDLKDLSKTQSSAPEAELWYDELPWIETSGYIKGILRNLLMYRLLDQGEFQMSDPVWRAADKPEESN